MDSSPIASQLSMCIFNHVDATLGTKHVAVIVGAHGLCHAPISIPTHLMARLYILKNLGALHEASVQRWQPTCAVQFKARYT